MLIATLLSPIQGGSDASSAYKVRKIAARLDSSTPSREKNPAGRRRSVLLQRAHTGTDSLNVVSVPPMLKKCVTRVLWVSIAQSVTPQLQQNDWGNPSCGLSISITSSSA